MPRLFFILLLFCLSLYGCRYWVLYEFAEQFCEFEEYVSVTLTEDENKQVQIKFAEPVLDRNILLRYLNAQPFEIKTKHNISAQSDVALADYFAFQHTEKLSEIKSEPFRFNLRYHSLDEHALLEEAYLDSRLSQLFSPVLVEPILRSLCSDDYDLSLKQLDMRFSLSALPMQSLPNKQQLESVFGKAEEIIGEASGEQALRYQLDFLTRLTDKAWQAQNKPITMVFSFDRLSQLTNLYIHYHKYSYWLDVENLSGRLLVIRRE